MSMMSRIKSMLKGHEDKAAKGIDMAGDMFDRRTRGKYRRHVGKVQRKLKDELARPEGERGRQPGGEPGTQPPHGPQDGHSGPYGGQDPYGRRNPYGGQNPQGGRDPYGGQGQPPQG